MTPGLPGLTRESDAGGGRDRAVDPGESAVGVHRDLLAAEHRVGHPDEARRAEDEPVVRPRRPPDGVGEEFAIERAAHSCQLGLHGIASSRRIGGGETVLVGSALAEVDGASGGCREPGSEPLAVGGSCGDCNGCRRRRAPVEVEILTTAADGDHLDVGTRQQTGHLAAESRMPEHDGALDATTQPVVAQQRAIAVHDLASEAGTADDLGDQRPGSGVRDLFGIRPGVGARDHDRARPALEHDRLCGDGSRSLARCDVDSRDVARQRFS